MSLMPEDVGLIGNAQVLGRVRSNGVLEDVFFPSKGYSRHILRSQFGVHLGPEGGLVWLGDGNTSSQDYLEDTFVVEGLYGLGEGIQARLQDFVPPEHDVFVRWLEVRNSGVVAREIRIVHAEAAALEENRAEFGFNQAYVNRRRRVLRYRGHPFDNAREAHCCVLIGAEPAPESFQVGRSFVHDGELEDAFRDAEDGELRGNGSCVGHEEGATSAFQWCVRLPPGGSARIRVILAAGTDTSDAERTLAAAELHSTQELLDRTRKSWRAWLRTAAPALRRVPTVRLRRLAARSLLILKLLQHRDGAIMAAPTLHPDYRYCWPRDAAYMAWVLSRFGYREEADQFFRWCAEHQMASGFWQQNYYTDGRPHWTALQVDQAGSVLWALGEHLAQHDNLPLARELWPMVRTVADALIAATDEETGLLSSPQDLWEECGGTFAYTNAACAAGLRVCSELAARNGDTVARGRYLRAADAMVRSIRSMILDGQVVAELHPHRNHAARHDYQLDCSILGLAVPYRQVHPEWPPLARAAQRVGNSFHWPAGGIGRYPGDRFEGGNPWPLCSIWLAAYHLAAGQDVRALEHLDWAVDQVTPLGHFPEQVHRESRHPVSAVPLGWAHAWYLWLLSDLYVLSQPAGERTVSPAQART
jgi:oligosaccharide amylase